MNRYHKLLYYSFGIGMTSPLIALVIAGHILSLTTVSIALVFFDLLFNNHKAYFSLKKQSLIFHYFLTWILISLVSSIFGFVFFIGIDNKEFAFSSIGFIPKILFYLTLLYLFSKDALGKVKMKYIIKGVKFGIILNLIWAIVDASMYYTVGESLTNNVFSSYIVAADMPNGLASTIDGVSIRSVGLNNDEATIGFFSICAVVYGFIYKKIWLIFVGVLASFSSVTFIGFVGIACAFVWQMFFRRDTKHKLRSAVLLLFLVFSAAAFFYKTNNEIVVGLRTAMELRAESKQDNDHSSATRKLFITKFPAAVTHLPTSLIIGTGYNSGVFAYYQEGLVYKYYDKNNPKPTAMENTFIEYFFDLGLFGTLIFILLYYKIFKISFLKFKNTGEEIYALFFAYVFGAFFEFAFYHNILYSLDMVACIAASLYLQTIPNRLYYQTKNINK